MRLSQVLVNKTTIGFLAGVGVVIGLWFWLKPEPAKPPVYTDYVPVDVVRYLEGKEKVVERVKFVTKEVPVDREVIKEVVRVIERDRDLNLRVRFDGDKVETDRIYGWKGFGSCEAKLDDRWVELIRAPLDLSFSKSSTTEPQLAEPPARRRFIAAGGLSTDGWLLRAEYDWRIQRRYSWLPQWIGVGGEVMINGSVSTPDLASENVYGALIWEWN